jgi:hypothetical protein
MACYRERFRFGIPITTLDDDASGSPHTNLRHCSEKPESHHLSCGMVTGCSGLQTTYSSHKMLPLVRGEGWDRHMKISPLIQLVSNSRPLSHISTSIMSWGFSMMQNCDQVVEFSIYILSDRLAVP